VLDTGLLLAGVLEALLETGVLDAGLLEAGVLLRILE
jgi:hypothetical protein